MKDSNQRGGRIQPCAACQAPTLYRLRGTAEFAGTYYDFDVPVCALCQQADPHKNKAISFAVLARGVKAVVDKRW